MFTSLRLERFKSFKDAELKLGPFTVLIGANASGKSNVRDAFRFLHGIGRGYSLAEIIGEKYGEGGERVWTGIRGGIPEIAFARASAFALEVQKLLRLPSVSLPSSATSPALEERMLDYRIEVKLDRKRAVPLVANERFRDQQAREELVGTATNGQLDVNAISSDGTSLDVRGQPPDHPFIYPFSNPFAVDPRQPTPTHNLSQRTITNLFLQSVRRMRFFEWSVDVMRQPAPSSQDVLSDDGRNLSSVLQAICRDSQGKHTLLSWITELTPMDAVDFEFSTDPTGKVFATLVEKNGQRITLASASDGTLRFLAFLAAFLGPHRSSFYFFEELENGIHPTRLSLLLDLIENQVKNRGIQVVATTHSPQLLGRLSKSSLEHASLIYRLEDQPDARIIRVLDMPDAKRLIKKYGAADLAASGWFNDTAHYMQPDPGEQQASPRPERRRKSRARA
jgi:predicted ATPase